MTLIRRVHSQTCRLPLYVAVLGCFLSWNAPEDVSSFRLIQQLIMRYEFTAGMKRNEQITPK